MTKYSIATQNYLGSGPTIMADIDGEKVPALFFSRLGPEFPFDIKALARNFCALLNGHSAAEKIQSPGEAIFYQGHPYAVTLRSQPEAGGMTDPKGVMVAINHQALPPEIVEELHDAINADFMKKLCDAVEMPSHSPAPVTRPGQHL